VPSKTELPVSVGVILRQAQAGKYIAERVFVFADGKKTTSPVTNTPRSLGQAHRAAVESFEVLLTDLSRGDVALEEPKQLKLFKVD